MATMYATSSYSGTGHRWLQQLVVFLVVVAHIDFSMSQNFVPPAPTDGVIVVPQATSGVQPVGAPNSNIPISIQPTKAPTPPIPPAASAAVADTSQVIIQPSQPQLLTSTKPLQPLPTGILPDSQSSSPITTSPAQQPTASPQPPVAGATSIQPAASTLLQQAASSASAAVAGEGLQPLTSPSQLAVVASKNLLPAAEAATTTTQNTAVPQLLQSTTSPANVGSSVLQVVTFAPSPTPAPNTPGPNTPLLGVIAPHLTTLFPVIAAPTPVQIGLEVWNCQILFANNFEQTLNASGIVSGDSAERVWTNDIDVLNQQLGLVIAKVVGVESVRITDVTVVKNPNTGGLVLKFSIRPPLWNCQLGCQLTSSTIVNTLRNKIDSLTFNLTYTTTSTQTLNIDRPPAFFAWTDKGPCPNVSCSTDSICNCRPTGQYYCQCVTDCMQPSTSTSSSTSQLLWASASTSQRPSSSTSQRLWALIIIPIVLIIILIVVFVLLIRQQRIKIHVLRRKPMKTVRDYKPAYDIGTIVDQPVIATLDPGAANRLYKTLGSHLGLAFNDRTFVDSDKDSNNSASDSGSGVGLIGPF